MSGDSTKSFWIRKPVVGLVAVTAGLLGQWLRHAIWPLTETWFGAFQYPGLIVIGAIGFGIIAYGLNKAEIPASVAGYVGGLLIWIGWFEFTFHYFADRFGIEPFRASERLVSSPDLNLVQASFPILLAMLLLYGFLNSQTKCNFMRWFHRNLRISPGNPIKNSPRSVARITAMETLLVIWFCYALWLIITYFSANIFVIGGAFLLWAVWFIYLFAKLLKINRAGYAFRYGIPVGIIGWVLVVTPSHMGMYPVIWLRPFDFPISSIVALVVFIATLLLVARGGRAAAAQE
jgi:hypothetical protein